MSILMVDDEPDLSMLVRQRFRRQIALNELQFVFALNGEEALEMLAADPGLDIVVSDINMPVMDGLTLLSHLANYSRPIKTVIVSAYDDMPNIRTAMNRGAYDFLTKPLDFADLEATLAKTRRELDLIHAGAKARASLALLQSELGIAMRIQRSILPEVISGHDAFEVGASMLPAQQVSGDFYDFFLIDADHLGFCIGDVSGKGIPAALYMAVSRTLLRATALRGSSPSECFAHVNDVLLRQSKGELFVTLFYAILDLRNGEVSFCAGGQNAPCLVSKDHSTRFLREPRGFMLGLLDDVTYQGGTATLAPGDSLVLYTDGVTEAEDVNSGFYSEERLSKTLRRLANTPTDTLVRGLLADINEFTGGHPQSDDITVLAVRYSGPLKPE